MSDKNKKDNKNDKNEKENNEKNRQLYFMLKCKVQSAECKLH